MKCTLTCEYSVEYMRNQLRFKNVDNTKGLVVPVSLYSDRLPVDMSGFFTDEELLEEVRKRGLK